VEAVTDNSPAGATAASVMTSVDTGVPTIPTTKLDKDKTSDIETGG